MKKILVTLIAGMFASVAAAQGTTDSQMTTKQKQEAVNAATSAGSDRRPGEIKQQEANVKASQTTEKMTTTEKQKLLKESNAKMVNPNNSAGAAATAKAQKENTAASKDQPKQNVNLNAPEAQKAMQKAATP